MSVQDQNIDYIWSISTFLMSFMGVCSWVVYGLAPESSYTFAAVSNMAFVGILLCSPIVAQLYLADIHPMIYEGMLVMVLIGASSWAFHSHPVIGSPRHTLDIAMGWVLYLYLASITMYAAMIKYIRARRLLLFVNVARAAAIVFMFYNYDSVKPHQLYIFVSCGFVAHVSMFITHITYNDNHTSRWQHATVNAMALVFMQFTAATVQGEFWYRSLSPMRYNIEHGYWHLLNAFIVSIIVMHTMQVIEKGRVPTMNDNEYVSRISVILFAVVLLVVTYGESGDTVNYAIIVMSNVILLVVSGMQIRRFAALTRSVLPVGFSCIV